ncbi:hypothetical protein I4F81_008759 [Pyropia yezoensis]|uniref:Uncharacterized protein n=1 Tax=Pyropia yezoensis TaxID=2788 RepID=A0ACC3C7F0_PYRYE|nr:hypothetical protein I4F81_008759 [Neopyropia yezoensis]|eukprot:contig_2980_g630
MTDVADDEGGVTPAATDDGSARDSDAAFESEVDMSVDEEERTCEDKDGADSSGSSSNHSEQDDLSDAVNPFVLPEDLFTAPAVDDGELEEGPVDGMLDLRQNAVDSRADAYPSLLSLPMPFKCVEHLYAYLLLRGQCHGTEELYDVVRAGINITSPVGLPTANTIRYSISPVVNSAWMLPLRTCSTRHVPSGRVVDVRYIAPSDHVRRDLQFASTFELFKKADARSNRDRELHPEFIGSPMFQDRASALLSGRLVPRFLLGGVHLAVGDRVCATLVGGQALRGIFVKRAFFAAAQSGLARNLEAHAGDFVVDCDNVTGEPEGGGYFVSRHWCAASLPPITWHSADDIVVEVRDINRVGRMGLAPDDDSGRVAEIAVPVDDSIESTARRPMWSQTDGEASLVVSLSVYSDGFGTQSGKEVTMGGVYMSYLSWLFQDRRSSNAARAVSVTPAGVDSDCVLDAITEDLRA